MGSILIKNGRVWDGDSFSVQDILIRESRIAQISKNITADADSYLMQREKPFQPGWWIFMSICAESPLGPLASAGR